MEFDLKLKPITKLGKPQFSYLIDPSITTFPNGDSPATVLLCESYNNNSKPYSTTKSFLASQRQN
jgi:hypothetical protein